MDLQTGRMTLLLPTLDDYRMQSLSRRLDLAKAVEKNLGQRFLLRPFDPEAELFPRFVDVEGGVELRLILGGTFQMGLSAAEEAAARRLSDPIPANLEEMRPVRDLTVESFLLSSHPLTKGVTANLLGIPDSSEAESDEAAWLTEEECLCVTERLGGRLPTEREWEYACRAGTSSLFTWGWELPTESELERWLSNDAKNPYVKKNIFGLSGLFWGEWCSDTFSYSYNPGAPIEEGSRVIRGGGSQFWPWQDEEWIWCASAMRMPSSALFDGRCGLRLALDLP